MIILYHNRNSVLQVTDEEGTPLAFNTDRCATALFEIADQYSEDWIIWCHNAYKKVCKPEIIREELHHKAMMISQSLGRESIIPPGIDYIEENPFMKVAQDVPYPTWIMHSDVGAIHAQVINQVKPHLPAYKNFNYFLNALAKCGQSQGLHCYQLPLLQMVSSSEDETITKSNRGGLSRFES